MDNTYTVSILMTKHRGWLARVIYFFTGLGYTHASISIDEEDVFYSFNMKGFRNERPKLYKHSTKKSLCYKIAVTRCEYEKMLEIVDDFKARRPYLKYSRLGVVLCLMGIPHKFTHRYFCSQFVAELLEGADVLTLNASPSVYLPKKLGKVLGRNTDLMEIVADPI